MPVELICKECKLYILFYETSVIEWDMMGLKYNLYHYRCFNK